MGSIAELGRVVEMFVLVVNGYKVDVEDFLGTHPGGRAKMNEPEGTDVSSCFNSHFGHTVRHFRECCKAFDRDPSQNFEVKFKNGSNTRTLSKSVFIVGKA